MAVLLTTLFLHLKNRFLKLLLSIQKRRIDLWESWDDVLHFRSIALMVHGSKYPFRGSGLKRDPGRPDHLFWGEFSSHFVSIFSCQIDKVILDVRCLVSLLSLTTNVIITTVVQIEKKGTSCKVWEEENIHSTSCICGFWEMNTFRREKEDEMHLTYSQSFGSRFVGWFF